LAGVPLPETDESVLDGRSFAGALTGDAVEERPVMVEMGYGRAIVSDGWKYIAVRFPEDVLAEAAKTGRRPTLPGAFNDRKARNPTAWPSFGEADQLFDLRADPLEQKNLAGDPAHAEKLAAMQKLLREAVAPLPHVYGEFKTAM
jgi:arylsulfatase A-like enzyme